MALTPDEKVTLAEIARETYSTVDTAAASLISAQETQLRLDITRWATVRGKHLKVQGGRDGIDLSPEREREEIRRRVRIHLGLPMYSEEELQYGDGVMQLFEIEVGGSV